MSGGSLDYAYNRVEEIAGNVASRATTPLHRAFAGHLMKVAKALHDLEWVWSSDFGKGDEEEAIRAVVSQADVLDTAVERAKVVLEELKTEVKNAEETVERIVKVGRMK